MQFDDIVVGGGTAGSVIAARLSEDRERRVLLLESGPDYVETIPDELLDTSFAVISGHNWDMQAFLRETGPIAGGRFGRANRVLELASSHLPAADQFRPLGAFGHTTSFPYPMGKVMGGGSSINSCLALHARPEDYANWSAVAGDYWSCERVRPYIDAIANGDSNKPALPLEIASLEETSPCQCAFLDACYASGYRQIDLRQGTAAGVGTLPKCLSKGRRVSTSALYLHPARSRPNLTIRPNSTVDRLLLRQTNGSLTATGVEALTGGLRSRFSGGHIILSAGAINSPAILLRSGIGAADEMARRNIRPLLNLPGVGKNLQDHPSVSVWGTPANGACVAGEPVHQLMVQQRSSASEALCDVQLFMLSGVRTQIISGLGPIAGSDLVLGVSAVLATPRSRGRVEIMDGDPNKCPRIYLNCLQDAVDLRRMMEAVRSAWCILRREPLRRHVDRFLLWTQNIIDSDTLLEHLLQTTVRATWHPAGTLRMGKAGDETAVVDHTGRLYGCRNVTVADASIMPTIPSVPLNLTCMLIGERIAAHRRGLET